MRVVLDTNVLISAVFFAGFPERILDAWVDRQFDMLASVEILREYRQVVARLERQFPSIEAQPLIDLITRYCHLVEPAAVPRSACEDPDDLKFLGCAKAGRAGCVVSGDHALLRASGFEGIEVLTPRVFVKRYL